MYPVSELRRLNAFSLLVTERNVSFALQGHLQTFGAIVEGEAYLRMEVETNGEKELNLHVE